MIKASRIDTPQRPIPTANRFDLTGKVALVTGGSRGIGRAMVMGFAAAGADVIIVSRKLGNCEELAQIVRSELGCSATAISCNVSQWDDVERLVQSAYGAVAAIDILVNNAGMSPVYDRLEDVDEALFDKVIGVNLKGPFRLSALIAARMARGRGGSIINISSVGAVRPTPNIAAYSAAKAGLNSITVAFAHAYGPSVRVNCIMPGVFMTDVSKAWDLDAVARDARRFALQRNGDADEIVGAALYFASDASSFTTGSVLRVDGGIPR